MEDVKKKFNLLMQPVWTTNDIITYFGDRVKSKPTAYRFKNMARDKYNGQTNLGKQYVKRDSVMLCFGTTTENEIKNMRLAFSNEELSETNL